ncbi:MAG: tetratricopeptide repeat protein, partial [Acidobacteria bacterium]|nr:tetratricopeptide repeat protein [Acidobacteriota bacterium]
MIVDLSAGSLAQRSGDLFQNLLRLRVPRLCDQRHGVLQPGRRRGLPLSSTRFQESEQKRNPDNTARHRRPNPPYGSVLSLLSFGPAASHRSQTDRHRAMISVMRDLATRIVLLGGMLVASAGPGFGQEEVLLELYNQARTAQTTGDFQTAIQKYERIVKLRPDMAEAYSNLGTLYYEQGQPERAGASFRRAIQLKPELSAPYFFLGVLALNSREYGGALKYLKQSERLGGATSLTSLYLGYTQYALANFREAAEDFERALDLEENSSDALYHLSKAYGHLAKHYFGVLKSLFPDSFHMRLARGHIYEALQKWDEASAEYELALSQQPANSRLQERRNWATRKASAAPPASLPAGSADEWIDG